MPVFHSPEIRDQFLKRIEQAADGDHDAIIRLKSVLMGAMLVASDYVIVQLARRLADVADEDAALEPKL